LEAQIKLLKQEVETLVKLEAQPVEPKQEKSKK